MSGVSIEVLVGTIKNLYAENEQLKAQLAASGKPAKPSNRKKLGTQEVKSIRDLRRIGCSFKDIADVFDCHPSTISRTVKGVYHK